MARVLELKQSDRIVIDAGRLEQLFKQLGDRAAEAHVMETVEDISDRLAEIEWQYRHGALDEVPPRAQRVTTLCADIGLTSLARVSRDLGISAGRGDLIAFRAVWERLVRIGDRSLAQVWELPGLSL